MPLDKSCSLDAFQSNVSASYKEGKRAKGTQHVAIALSTLKRACGVPDDDRKMTPKEIVASGAKGESRSFVRLGALIERDTVAADPEQDWLKWVMRLRDVAGMAVKEAGRWKRGPATDQLASLLQDFLQHRVVIPAFEDAPGSSSHWTEWRGWVSRVEMAAANQAVPELAGLIRAFGDGRVAMPKRMSEAFGIDFAIRTTSPRGGQTSPASAPPETKGGNDTGTFRVYADNGEIKSGDGRAPKTKKSARK